MLDSARHPELIVYERVRGVRDKADFQLRCVYTAMGDRYEMEGMSACPFDIRDR